MHYQGMEFLLSHEINLRGPNHIQLFKSLQQVCLKELFHNAIQGITILSMDATIPLNKKAPESMKKNTNKEGFSKAYEELIKDTLEHIPLQDIVFAAYKTDMPEDIACWGTAIVQREQGYVSIRATQQKREELFITQFAYTCPLDNGRVDTKEMTISSSMNFPVAIREYITNDALKIPGNPHLDFVVYKKTKNVRYHNLFLEGGKNQPGIMICDAQ